MATGSSKRIQQTQDSWMPSPTTPANHGEFCLEKMYPFSETFFREMFPYAPFRFRRRLSRWSPSLNQSTFARLSPCSEYGNRPVDALPAG